MSAKQFATVSVWTPDRRTRTCVVEFMTSPAPCDHLYTVLSCAEVIGGKKWPASEINAWNGVDLMSSRIAAFLNKEHEEREKSFKRKRKTKKEQAHEDLLLGELPL